MFLKNLYLLNFKNYEEVEAEFSPQINCLLGKNGSGKTNLLDAIYYLGLSKSAFNSIDTQNIRHEESLFVIKGNFEVEEEVQEVFCGVQQGQKKIFKLQQKPYDKIKEHIGKFPVIMIAPNDTDLIREGSEIRRKFFDTLLSQMEREYLEKLIHYNHYLKQRNALLKSFAEKNYIDKTLLGTYDKQILSIGKLINQKRQHLIEVFQPIFQEYYEKLSDKKEQVSLAYQSHFSQERFKENYQKSIEKDLILQRTTQGIHKDDFVFKIQDYPLKKFGSQGQQKSYIIALKLAQFDSIFKQKALKPLLLLDDIFDKLDESRIKQLLALLEQAHFGQVFITDARPERTQKLLKNTGLDKRFFQINEGVFNA